MTVGYAVGKDLKIHMERARAAGSEREREAMNNAPGHVIIQLFLSSPNSWP